MSNMTDMANGKKVPPHPEDYCPTGCCETGKCRKCGSKSVEPQGDLCWNCGWPWGWGTAGAALVADTVSIAMCDQCPDGHPKAFCPKKFAEKHAESSSALSVEKEESAMPKTTTVTTTETVTMSTNIASFTLGELQDFIDRVPRPNGLATEAAVKTYGDDLFSLSVTWTSDTDTAHYCGSMHEK